MENARKTTRLLLWKWGNWVCRMNRLEQERKAARQWADDARCTLRAQSMTGMPGGGQKRDLSDVVVSTMNRLRQAETLEKKIDTEISDLIRLRNSIEELIAKLPPDQEKILTYRYVDGHRWQYIAMKTNYDESYARKLEARAVDFIAEHVEVEK